MRCIRCYAPLLHGQRFCSHCGWAAARPTRALGSDDRTHDTDHGEFRHLSIIFSDIEDSARLTVELGAERFREVLRDYREIAAQIFAKYGGHIARYLGDGTLIYFGYPQMHEDNATRAVHAAFELIAALRKQAKWKVNLRVRVAVHTGTVVVGDLRSETTSEALAIVGDVPNIAARLQMLADPGTVVISSATYELIRQDFVCTCLGPHMLKGFPAPVVTYRVDEVATPRTRSDAWPRRGELIGRSDEARTLADAWADALIGQGRVVLVLGEPGIGKSRLIAEVVSKAEKDAARLVGLQCSSIYQNTALYPVVDHLTALFGLDPEQSDAQRVARMETTFLSRDLDPAEYVPLFASLLGVAHPSRGAQYPQLSPQQEREYVKKRIGDWLIHVAKRQPILLVVEDLHWADPSTIEFLSEVLPRLATERVLVVMSSRYEFETGSLGPALITRIDLRRLDPEDAKSMIKATARSRELSSATLELIESKTDGMPLYIEEMTRAVIDVGLDHRDGATLAMAASLSESLSARIDQVAASRELLEIIGSLGREFDFELVSALWDHESAALRADLEKLTRARLLRETNAGGTRFIFCHALIQETIYDSLLASRRRAVHGKIAKTLAHAFPRVAQDRPELVAHHFLRAGEGHEALPFLRKAASAAIRRSAHVEAQRYLHSAQDVAGTMPEGSTRTRLKVELLLSLGVVLTASSGYATEEVGNVFGRARELCRNLDSAADLFPVLHGLYRFFYVRAELGSATELADQMLFIARNHCAPALLLEAHRAAANCCFSRGLFDQAEAHFAEALSRYDPIATASHRYVYSLDPFVGAGSVRALNAWCRGDRAAAKTWITETLSAAERLDHPFSLAWNLSFAAVIHSLEDDMDRLHDCAERLIACADGHFFPFWRMTGLMSLGWWLHRSGSGRMRGAELLREGIAGWERMGGVSFRAYFMSLLARAHLHDAKANEARAVLDAALDLAIPRGEVWWVPELRRLRTLCEIAVE